MVNLGPILNQLGQALNGWYEDQRLGQVTQLSGDGERLCLSYDPFGIGAVQCFELAENSWSPIGDIMVGDLGIPSATNSGFGQDLALSRDGRVISIASQLGNEMHPLTNSRGSGIVYTDALGCMDANACNFVEYALFDDGSCAYDHDECGVCGGSGAVFQCGCNPVPPGACDCEGNVLDALGVCGGQCAEDLNSNGICDSVEGGCTNGTACNYDPEAEFDNGDCIFSGGQTCEGECILTSPEDQCLERVADLCHRNTVVPLEATSPTVC